jgi:hypothetical protein
MASMLKCWWLGAHRHFQRSAVGRAENPVGRAFLLAGRRLLGGYQPNATTEGSLEMPGCARPRARGCCTHRKREI